MTYKTVKDYLRENPMQATCFCLHDIPVSCFLELVWK